MNGRAANAEIARRERRAERQERLREFLALVWPAIKKREKPRAIALGRCSAPADAGVD